MNISGRERTILGALDLLSDATITTLAKTLKLKIPSVHYAIRSLSDRGILRRRADIDFFKLGLLDLAIFFSVGSLTRSGRAALERTLVGFESCSWVGRLAGEYHYAGLLLCRSFGEVRTFLDAIQGVPDLMITDRIIAPRTSYTEYSRKYLSGTRGTVRVGEFQATERPSYTPDELDHRILSHLGTQPFDSIRSLARDLGTPFSTVERRMQALRQAGVLRGIRFEVIPSGLGVQCFRLIVNVRGCSSEIDATIATFCRSHPHVTFFVRAFGSWDFEIGLEVEDAGQVMEVVSELSESLGVCLGRVTAIQEVHELKWSYYPFRKNPFAR